MYDEFNLWLAAGAFTLGAFFGIVCQRSRFCVVAALSNLVLMRDYRQLHAYLAALGVALAGTGLLEWGQWVDVAASSYRNTSLNWFGALGGGLIFGVGAMLAGGCATRTLIRTAEGNIGALVTLIAFALVGMATLFGVLDAPRGWLSQSTSIPQESTATSIAIQSCIAVAGILLGMLLVLWKMQRTA